MSSGNPVIKEFRIFLLNLAEQLKEEESDRLRWLYGLPVRLEGASPLNVLQEMEALDLFSATNFEALTKMMKEINRIDLAKRVTDYAKNRSSKRKKKVIAQSEDHRTTLIANVKVALIHTNITIEQLERVQDMMPEIPRDRVRKMEGLIREAKEDAERIQRRLEEAATLSLAEATADADSSPSPRSSGEDEIHPLKGARKPMPPPKPQKFQSTPVSSGNKNDEHDLPEAGIGGQWNILPNEEHIYAPVPLISSSDVPKSQLVAGKSGKPPAPPPKPKDKQRPSPQVSRPQRQKQSEASPQFARTHPQRQKQITSNHDSPSPPPTRIPKPTTRTQNPLPTRNESTAHRLERSSVDYTNYSSDFSSGNNSTGDSGFAEVTPFLRQPLSKPHHESVPEEVAYYKSLDRKTVTDVVYDQPTKSS